MTKNLSECWKNVLKFDFVANFDLLVRKNGAFLQKEVKLAEKSKFQRFGIKISQDILSQHSDQVW